MKRPELFEEEKKIWYSRFYDLPLEGIREADHEFLDQPMPVEKTVPLERVLDFLKVKDEKEEVENGYCILPDGHSYVTCTQYYPEFTVDMLMWWFDFLNHRPKGMAIGKGNLRYKIWCPPDHWDHGLLDPEDENSGLFVNETLDLGAGTMDRIENINRKMKPRDIGMPEKMEKELKEAGYAWIAGIGYGHGLPGGCGFNVFKPVPEGGIKWASVGWSGYRFKNGKPEAIPGAGTPTLDGLRTELIHNVVERRHLAKFLGELYAVQSKKPLDED